MKEDIKKYNAEWVILEKITMGEKDNIDDVKFILENYNINWGELIEQAMSHKIFPMVAYFFISNDLFDKIPPFINQYFRVIYDVNREKVKKIKEETIKIAEKLSKKNIQFVATKGIVLDNELYENEGYRFLSDADFIVKSQYKKEVMDLLNELGFSMGTVDWKSNGIREFSRQEYLIYINTPDKLPEFVKKIDDEIIKYVSVGFVCSLTWEKCEYKVDIDKAFQDIRSVEIGIDNYKIPVLDIAYHYIYIILHLYKHAWLEYLSRWNNDVNLAKFGDVYRYYKKYEKIILTKLPEIIKNQNIEKPVIWTLQHTDEIFGSNIVEKLGYKGFLDYDYLHSSGDKKGNVRKWNGTMRERLFSKNRKLLFM